MPRFLLRFVLVLTCMVTALGAVAAGSASAAPAIAWNQGIKWVPFDTALKRAKTENKSVCVVVYADWCPKCRSLAPKFGEQPITGAASDVIMVLQNSDERPEWLRSRFGDLGNYVPRVFFLKPDGSVNKAITSGNDRFPFFYRASEAAKLASSIGTAAKAAGPAKVAVPQPAAAPAAVAVAPAAPAAPAAATTAGSGSLAGSSDLPILALLAAFAVAAVWFVSRKGDAS
ncbi:MAG: thioredoxin family protein [Myxococcales bacterium]|nr:thioredoxin family protein [Myxococcales bacterium]